MERFLTGYGVDKGWYTWILSKEDLCKELSNCLEPPEGLRDFLIVWKSIFKDLKRRRVRSFLDDNSVEIGWQATIMGNEAIWTALAHSINKLDQLDDVIPERNKVLAAFKYCRRSKVKTIIIGHDPIPYREFATGLAFSYPEGTVLPPCDPGRHRYKQRHAAMRRLHDVLSPTSPAEEETSACHITWAKKGVLLLNAALTYTNPADQQLNIHQEIWQEFLTKLLAEVLGDTFNVQGPLYVVCWGTFARALYVNLTADGAIAPNKYLYLGHHPTFEMKDLKKSDFHGLHKPPPYDAGQSFKDQAKALFKEIHQSYPGLFSLDRVGADEDRVETDEDRVGADEDRVETDEDRVGTDEDRVGMNEEMVGQFAQMRM
ncbi:uracil-DNA glycosylase-like [Mya arenaria]|uniref:uracil-DNA glycosylase-like n=1 Tax=Mya arenaria TaxID=6604 RepID=UPI0022E3A906|nr:uracil-DNA glycosylase-like [Mya arenaria]